MEYGTGVVVSDDGAIVADRQITDGCLTVAIAGHGNADRIAEDKEHDLALLRIYGARGLKALDLASAASKTALDLTGIADPQSQNGGAAVSGSKASVAQLGGGGDMALTPAPAARLLRRARAGWRRQICRHRAVEAGSGGGAGHRIAGGAGVAGERGHGARISQGQWRDGGGSGGGCESVGGAGHLREEVDTRVPDAVQRATLLRRAGTHGAGDGRWAPALQRITSC